MAIATQPTGSSRDHVPAPSIKRCLDATVQAADRLDDWIGRYVVDPSASLSPDRLFFRSAAVSGTASASVLPLIGLCPAIAAERVPSARSGFCSRHTPFVC